MHRMHGVHDVASVHSVSRAQHARSFGGHIFTRRPGSAAVRRASHDRCVLDWYGRTFLSAAHGTSGGKSAPPGSVSSAAGKFAPVLGCKLAASCSSGPAHMLERLVTMSCFFRTINDHKLSP